MILERKSKSMPIGSVGEPKYPVTPDGRYFIVRGRLWRRANPNLSKNRLAVLVRELMDARRHKKHALANLDKGEREQAKQRIDVAKTALGERGPVWWTDGSPDYNRHLVTNSPYADWFARNRSDP